MKKLLMAAMAAAAYAGIATATPANATPPCEVNWSLGSDGYCHPIYSTPINGYDPYDPSGEGFLRGLGPDSSWDDGQPTITNPRGVTPVTKNDIYTLICNDLDLSGVSVASVENIYHVLYEEPYQYAPRDAGRTVALAVQDVCPKYKSPLMEAARQASS
jgi:hypothetical protein